MTQQVSAVINGTPFHGAIAEHELLLDFLRDRLGLAGTKRSCEVEVCGACTVLVDGEPVSSCCYLACDIDGREVQTIEGMVGTEFYRVAEAAFLRNAAVQCGFCSPGMILTAKVLADRGIGPDREQVIAELSGNLCRCTGYRPIAEAITQLLTEVGDGR